MTNSRTAVGVIGCGAISAVYFEHLATFPWIEVVACADLDLDRAKDRATQFGVARALTTPELLADPDIEVVVNLTTPKIHHPVAMDAVAAGKSVYNEKPLCASFDQARELLAAAERNGVLVGGAPDTFLGRAGQAARREIDAGAIGSAIGGVAFMTCRGHESWHPDPAFYYQVGGGPLFDMGPYYLTALVNVLGPIRSVAGVARKTFATRTITSAPKNGETIDVEVPTHVSAVLDFHNGAVVTAIMSFDVWNATLPRLEVYGTEGSISMTDPNAFEGPVRLWRGGGNEWEDVNTVDGYVGNRGIGVADLALALRAKTTPRASGALAAHVLEAMEAIHTASETGRHVELMTTCDRPAPLPWPFTAENH